MSRVRPLEQNSIKLLPADMRTRYFQGDSSFARMGVSGDGSCFFYSVCAGLNKSNFLYLSNEEQNNVGQKFRCGFSKKLSSWDSSGGVSVAEAGGNFCNPTAWADEGMIKHASKILGRNIVFIDTSNGKMYCGVRGDEREPMIVILWLDRSHFEPLVRVVGRLSLIHI